jgi:hypothetical protein
VCTQKLQSIVNVKKFEAILVVECTQRLVFCAAHGLFPLKKSGKGQSKRVEGAFIKTLATSSPKKQKMLRLLLPLLLAAGSAVAQEYIIGAQGDSCSVACGYIGRACIAQTPAEDPLSLFA